MLYKHTNRKHFSIRMEDLVNTSSLICKEFPIQICHLEVTLFECFSKIINSFPYLRKTKKKKNLNTFNFINK